MTKFTSLRTAFAIGVSFLILGCSPNAGLISTQKAGALAGQAKPIVYIEYCEA